MTGNFARYEDGRFIVHRIKEAFVVHGIESAANRHVATIALKGKGATVIDFQSSFDIAQDEIVFRATGYVLEDHT